MDKFKTPSNAASRVSSTLRSTMPKRDSLAAELDRDPQMSTAKRQQRSQVLSSHMSHSALERRLASAELAKKELENKLREKQATMDALENDRRWLAESEAQERAEKEQERAAHAEERMNVEREMRELRAALSTLRDQHDELRDTAASNLRKSAQTISAQKGEISTLERQVAQLRRELGDAVQLADERSHTIEDVQSQMRDLSMHVESEAARRRLSESTIDYTVMQRELQECIDQYRTLEAQNARLVAELTVERERRTNIEILREEKHALEKKAGEVDELRMRAAKLEGELAAARRERAEWAHKATQLETPSQTPVSVTQKLAQLRLEHAHLLEDHGANVALLRQRETELQDRQAIELELRATLEEAQQRDRAAAETISRLKRSVTLAEREVGFLQKFNASFTLEASSHDDSMVDDPKDQHVRDLEGLLHEYRDRVQTLEDELSNFEGQPTANDANPNVRALREELEKQREAARAALSDLEQANAANEKHLDAIDKLEQTLFELRGEIGAGRHVPPGTRILTLKDNPAQQWADLRQEVMDRLKNENEALLRRLKELEESGVQSASAEQADLVPRESLEVATKEKVELENTVKQKEKRLLRLQQVFTAKSTEFREAIAAIMGVKLAFYPNGQVRVTSQYDLNASFVFQPTSARSEGGARMQLIAQGEGGPQELPQLMRNWVEIEQSIPCFLSSVTLECYDKWKADKEMGIER